MDAVGVEDVGVLGDHGMGLAERENLQQRITFQMGTLSKAADVLLASTQVQQAYLGE